jgi:hypothetical protein
MADVALVASERQRRKSMSVLGVALFITLLALTAFALLAGKD